MHLYYQRLHIALQESFFVHEVKCKAVELAIRYLSTTRVRQDHFPHFCDSCPVPIEIETGLCRSRRGSDARVSHVEALRIQWIEKRLLDWSPR